VKTTTARLDGNTVLLQSTRRNACWINVPGANSRIASNKWRPFGRISMKYLIWFVNSVGGLSFRLIPPSTTKTTCVAKLISTRACSLRFLLDLFTHTRENEVRAILEMRGIHPCMVWARSVVEGDETPFMEVDLQCDDDAAFIASRAVSIRGIFAPWGTGTSETQCLEDVCEYPLELQEPFLRADSTFKINIATVGGQVPLFQFRFLFVCIPRPTIGMMLCV